MEDLPVLTPISLATFPCYVEQRKRLTRGQPPPEVPLVPSFTDILLHRISTNPRAALPNPLSATTFACERQEHLWDTIQSTIPHLNNRLKVNQPFYYQYRGGEPSDYERVQRSNGKIQPRKTYLTSATLIVVPVNLISQWDREIHKHCAYPLRVLIVRSRNQLPSARVLASDYDVSSFLHLKRTFC